MDFELQVGVTFLDCIIYLHINMRVKVTSIFWNNASIEEKTVYKKLFKHVHEIQKKNYILDNDLTRIELLLVHYDYL